MNYLHGQLQWVRRTLRLHKAIARLPNTRGPLSLQYFHPPVMRHRGLQSPTPHEPHTSRTLEARIFGWKERNPNGSYEQWLTYEKDYQKMNEYRY